MKLKGAGIFIWIVVLTNCAPSKPTRSRYDVLGTGYKDSKGIPYVYNGDPYLYQRRSEQLQQETIPISTPRQTPAPAPKASPPARTSSTPSASQGPANVTAAGSPQHLRDRVREFEISRFDKPADGKESSAQPSRFGKWKFEIKVFLLDEPEPVVFKEEFDVVPGRLNVKSSNKTYTLEGHLNDYEPIRTAGVLKLTHTDPKTQTKEQIEISYRASRAGITIRENPEYEISKGSDLECHISSWRDEKTIYWAHNWNVVEGKAFYLVDIVMTSSPRCTSRQSSIRPGFSIKGESKRTADYINYQEIEAETPNSEIVKRVYLAANGERVSSRSFRMILNDREAAEREKKNEVLKEVVIDVKMQGETPLPLTRSQSGEYGPGNEQNSSGSSTPIYGPGQTSPTPTPNGQGESADGRNQPPAEAVSPPASLEPLSHGNGYLAVDSSHPRIQQMTRDFDRNRGIPGVISWIKKYQTTLRRDMQNFFDFAYPFRAFLERVGVEYEVSPAFTYLTVVESRYFIGGKYEIQRSSAGALGPFQILPGTARKDLKMHVTNRADDERAFFAPSACGGAEYLRRMVDNFRGEGKDSTVAILAYYQGPAGASAAIVCSQEKDLSARRTCALQIDPNDVREHNKRAKNKLARYNQGEFNYFYRHAKNYQYAYADLESLGYLPGHMSNYVNKKLAVYFVASHMRDYGFEISSNKRTTLPDNAKPSRPINDEKCRRIAAELLR